MDGQPTLTHPARSPEVLNLLVRLITLSMSMGLNSTSLFLSERYSCLCAGNEEAVFLHALSLLRCHEHRQALEILKATLVNPSNSGHDYPQHGKRPACEASIRCAWVYAEACNTLGRPNEGGECLKTAFLNFGGQQAADLAMLDLSLFPSSSHVNSSVTISLSLARLAIQANKPDVAAQNYLDALHTAWWCWEAYEGLCTLGRAPDADDTFPAISVPTVTQSTESAENATNLTSKFATLQATRSHSQDHNITRASTQIPSATSPALSGSTITPAQSLPLLGHFRQKQSTFGLNSLVNTFAFTHGASPHSDVNTPLENQGAAFQFGEAGVSNTSVLLEANYDDNASFPATRGIGIGMGMPVAETGSSSESNFFTAAPVVRDGPAVGGLFAFGKQPLHGGKKMFGNGLLFGNASKPLPPTHASSSANGDIAVAGGSFFTPVATRPFSNGFERPSLANGLNGNDDTARTRPGQQARPPPAVKRSRNQVDVDDKLPSLLFQARLNRQAPMQTNSHHNYPSEPNGHGENYSLDIEDDEQELEQKALLFPEPRTVLTEEVEDSSLFGPSHNRAPRKGTFGTRRSNRINGTNGHTNDSALSSASEDNRAVASPQAGKGIRVATNPRERKRSKAGPSNYEDTTNTASSIESASQTNSVMSPRLFRNSSSPPSTTTSHPDLLPPSDNMISEIPNEAPSTTSHPSQQQGISSQPIISPVRSSYRHQLDAAQKALAENWLRKIYLGFGRAASSISRYDCRTTIKAVLELPTEQQKCSRAVLLLARAHFESLNYEKAAQAFATARELAAYATAGMEIYSTLLWHLHRPTQLSFLAQELHSISNRLPQAWIATGNIFSHLEDHPNALKCFKRAIQSDPSFTYSYTLAGHECITMEEWETATGFFREAIRREPRHYNAWFGLGNVYIKTGKYRMAEYHFRKAVDIHGSNAMLVCCVGTVLEKLDRKKEALEMYERACLLAPTSPAVRFKRVRMLMELRQFDSALRDLMIVRELAPDEFNVYYLLGKLYGAMGDKANMTRSLTFAQDLEPRAAGRIREIIENSGKSLEEEQEESDGDPGMST